MRTLKRVFTTMPPFPPKKLSVHSDAQADLRDDAEISKAELRALEEIRRAHYDLVLMDQMMPGMCGSNLLRLLGATQSSTELPGVPGRVPDQDQRPAAGERENHWHSDPRLSDHTEPWTGMAEDLRYAIRRHQFEAFYQPKFNLRTRAIVGFEALLRWRHPEKGLIGPSDFIPLAEETGLIVPIGEWILNEACWQLKHWQSKFPSSAPLSMNVNLSVKQLPGPDLVKHVRAILDKTGLQPDSLKLELTETALRIEVDSAKVLQELQAMHVGLKLDDFGTGYSSLSDLRALHFDSLKIDRSFVMRMAEDADSHAIVESFMKLARALDMSVVAEGIEVESQATELMRLGCHTGQGFLFSKPLPARAAEELLASL